MESFSKVLLASMLPLFLHKGRKIVVKHQETCPECKRTLVNLYKHVDKWKCKKCWDKEALEPPKLIKTWDELRECESETHYLEIDDYAGWIHSKTPKSDDSFDGSHYLSTHTFYGHNYEYSTELLQSCGFNVVIANWDELGW